MQKKTCFVISPIGKEGSPERLHADDVYDLLIEPALEKFDFDVWRADKKFITTDIVEEMIEDLHQSDLCIVLLTGLNPNVMYELGIRYETGKPFILLIDSKDFETVPFDTSTKRTIAYDLQRPREIRKVVVEIQSRIEYEFRDGFSSPSRATLSSIASTLNRVEAKLETLLRDAKSNDAISPTNVPSNNADPRLLFKIALRQKDVSMLDSLLPRIQHMVPYLTFHDNFVSVAAARGSATAGQMMKKSMAEFMSKADSFSMKYEYISCYVSYVSKRDEEDKEYSFIMDWLEKLIAEGASDDELAGVYNQMNRLSYGVYCNTDDEQYLDLASKYINIAIEKKPDDGSYYYNRAIILRSKHNISAATEDISRCLHFDGKNLDANHLLTACQLFKQCGSPDYDTALAQLEKSDSTMYQAYVMGLLDN